MIDSIKFNQVAFKSNQGENFSTLPVNRERAEVSNQTNVKNELNTEAPVVEEKSFHEKAKSGILNFIKGAKKFVHTASGVFKGVTHGVVATLGTAFIAKNIQKGEGAILGTLKGMGGDIVNGTKNLFGIVPKALNTPILDWFKAVPKLPAKFYAYCSSGIKEGATKGTKTVGIIATAVGVGVLTYNIIKGKLEGNKSSSDVDHYTDNGHVKY